MHTPIFKERKPMTPLTDYNRINIIVPREEKKKIVAWCQEHKMTLTSIMRIALRDFFRKQGVKL
jgi:hypothetical protein